MALKIESAVFGEGEEIPSKYTCEGEDLSPELKWSGLPEGTKSLALIVDDPDAPDPEAPKMVYVHWVVYDIPVECGGFEEAVGLRAGGGRDGVSDFKRLGWGGPCPPIGRHRYFFKLYALDAELGDLGSVSKEELLKAMEGHVLEEAQLIGTYQKR